MFDLSAFTTSDWLVLVAAAFVFGMSKGGLPGISIVAIPWVANLLGSKQSTGFILPMLIFGDFIALAYFRRVASIKDVLRALPWAIVGVLVGWQILRIIPDAKSNKTMDYAVAGIVLFILALQILNKCKKSAPANSGDSSKTENTDATREKPFPVLRYAFSVFMGFLGGVTTMLANAAGPVMSAYFLALKLSKTTFIGTCAWFFFVINIIKAPFMLNEKMITPQSLMVNLYLIPAVLLGVFAGVLVVKRINQNIFEWTIIILAAAGCFKLLGVYQFIFDAIRRVAM